MTWHRSSSRRPPNISDPVRDKARNRLNMVETSEVMNWAEQAVNGFHQTLDVLRKGPDDAALQECRQAVSMLAGAVDVLERRMSVLGD